MIDVMVQRWGLKLLAGAIAFAIWLAVVGQNETVLDGRPPLEPVLGNPAARTGPAAVAPAEVTFAAVPVTVVGASGPTSPVPSSVTVRISGPPALIARIHSTQIRAVVDVRGFESRPAPYVVPLAFVLEDLSPSDLARITVRAVSRSKIEVQIPDRREPS